MNDIMQILAPVVERIVEWLIGQGISGIIILGLAIALWYKDREVRELNRERIEDLKEIQAEQIEWEMQVNETLNILITLLGGRGLVGGKGSGK